MFIFGIAVAILMGLSILMNAASDKLQPAERVAVILNRATVLTYIILTLVL